MVANDRMLQVVGERIEFWRAELQAAFRSGSTQRIAECTRVLEEYGLLTSQVMNHDANAAGTGSGRND
jgi:hypothetical protein